MSATDPARIQPSTQKIITFLWFDNNAEEAVKFYCSISDESIDRWPERRKPLGLVEGG